MDAIETGPARARSMRVAMVVNDGRLLGKVMAPVPARAGAGERAP